LEAKQWLRSPPAGALSNAAPLDQPSGAALDAAPSGRLLVADDNADMREYLARLLSPYWQLVLVSNGRAALEQALASPPDLVLSDVMMPEMDGVALLNALRADPRTSTLPVILISARAGEDARLAGLETGADDYLVKPFAAREVITRVRTHLEMAKVRRAAASAAEELAETRAKLLEQLGDEHAALEAAYRELQRTQAQLVHSAKMASLGELVAGIAHEVNNPLAFALAHLRTVERCLRTVEATLGRALVESAGGAWQRALSRAHEMHVGLERIQELVLKLRTFSRLDEGEYKRVSTRESVQSVLMILQHRVQGRPITITTELGEPDQIECFAGLFNQAVMNLIANAIDAIEAEGTISIVSRVQDRWFELRIADTGGGIPADIRERVFEPFFTTKPVGKGTGLGLSITHSIAERHGGTIELQPNRERGTLATLRFPLR
jgi:two-component system NtrC family sensor kinase